MPVGEYTGARIHQLMWLRKIPQTRVAAVVGINQTTLSRKLRGRVSITIEELMTIARFLDVEPGDLLPPTGEEVRHQGLEPRTL